jgi:hypothetical protein
MTASTQINGYVSFLNELVRYEGEWNKQVIEDLLYPEVVKLYGSVSAASYGQSRELWECNCLDTYEELKAGLGNSTHFAPKVTHLDEAVHALSEQYLSDLIVHNHNEIYIILNTELVGQGIDELEVTFSKACQVWFEKCEQTFFERLRVNPPPEPPSSPIMALVA